MRALSTLQEKVMKPKFTLHAAALALSFAAAGLPQPAQATDARQAIKLCDNNPKCSYVVRDNGSVDLSIGDNRINCPQEGPCTCDICDAPSGIKPTTKKDFKVLAPRIMDVLKR